MSSVVMTGARQNEDGKNDDASRVRYVLQKKTPNNSNQNNVPICIFPT